MFGCVFVYMCIIYIYGAYVIVHEHFTSLQIHYADTADEVKKKYWKSSNDHCSFTVPPEGGTVDH